MLKPIFILLGCLLPALAVGGSRIVHHESPADWQFEPAATAADGGTISFTGFGRAWELELTANARLATQLGTGASSKLSATPALYRGRIRGMPDSWLRLTRDAADRWSGALWDGSELYAVEQPETVAGATELPVGSGPGPVLFRLADLRLEPGTVTCAAGGPIATVVTAKSGYDALVTELAKTADRRLDIAVFGDAEFSARHTDPLAALATRINTIDGIFSEQVGIAINVTRFRSFGIADDPFTDSTDANTLLSNLGRYKSDQTDLRGLGLVHLYTGKNLDDSTAGIAYTNALCSTRFGAGLSEGRRTAITDSLIGAHEIGHNFGAPHDGEDGSACESTPQTFIMAPRLNGSSTFSACSLKQMAPEIAAASCLGAVYDVDLSVDAGVSAGAVLEGESIGLDVTITNLGTVGADDVSLRIDLPTNVRLVDPGALCVAAAGGADCPVGTVPPGGSASAALTLVAETIGSGTIRAVVSTDTDRDPTNDLTSIPLRVDPAVDLGISLQAPATLLPGATTNLEVVVSNASARAATDVVASITLPTVLTASGPAPAGVDCTVRQTEVICRRDLLAGDEAFAFRVQVTAGQAGSGAILADVTAAEGDPDETDNSARRSIEVAATTATTSGGGGGGGGGSGLWLLLALLPALAARRR
jgi:hypothetical protein